MAEDNGTNEETTEVADDGVQTVPAAEDPQAARESSGSGSNGSTAGNEGKIEQVIGVVVDVVFPDELPEIYSALKIEVPEGDGRNAIDLTLEVQQHVGDDRVRAVAMDATDGLRRGDKVIDTGSSITVPVGKDTLLGGSSTSSASRSTRASRSRARSAGRSIAPPRRPRT
jgi:F0F1-type ATP synthase alpha subunit